MLITLARSWIDDEHAIEYGPDETIEVSDDTARQLIQDGRARAAGIAEDADEAGEADPSADADGQQADDSASSAENAPEPPPHSGDGSSDEAWHTYAKAVGVEVDPSAPRRAVIRAIREAGKPVEPAQPNPDSPATGNTSEGVS